MTSHLNGSKQRKRGGHPKVDLQSIVKFEKDREFLKKYIEKHFSDAEMIDYEKETKELELAASGGLTHKEIDRQFAEESQRAWRFLSDNVILREATRNPNKHQKLVKERAH